MSVRSVTAGSPHGRTARSVGGEQGLEQLGSKALACGLIGLILALPGCGTGPDRRGRDAADGGQAIGSPEASANAEAADAPPAAFARCRVCHSIEQGRQAAGPSLFGIFGRKAASQKGYLYSPALQQSGIVWDRASLDEWLKAPIQLVPGTRMVMGESDPEQRRAIIDYLEGLK